MGVKISRKFVRLSDVREGGPSEIQMVLWDLEGGSTFREAADSYIQGAHAAVVVGDLTRNETINTINTINNHIDHFLRINPRGAVIVALNKTDLQADAPRSSSNLWDGRKAVLLTLHTSARTGECVDRIFEELGQHLIRELANAIERAMIVGDGGRLEAADLALVEITQDKPKTVNSFDDVARQHILDVLRECRGVIEGSHGAAEKLGINPATLRSRMKKLGIGRTKGGFEALSSQSYSAIFDLQSAIFK